MKKEKMNRPFLFFKFHFYLLDHKIFIIIFVQRSGLFVGDTCGFCGVHCSNRIMLYHLRIIYRIKIVLNKKPFVT